MRVISLNGCDGVGKTTHVRWLLRSGEDQLSLVKRLSAYSDGRLKGSGPGSFDWWFREVSISDFISIIIDALNRQATDYRDEAFTILDRGVDMYKAVCVATWMTRHDIAFTDAIKAVDARFQEGLDFEPKEYVIILEPSPRYQDSIALYLQFLKKQDKDEFKPEERHIYQQYQKQLRGAFRHYFSKFEKGIRVTVDAPIVEIHNLLRQSLNNDLGLDLPLLCKHVSLVVCLGGMSQAGKSTLGDFLRQECGFYRLKIRYFTQLAERLDLRKDVEAIAMELIEFIDRHYVVDRFSIESLHAPDLAAFLKLFLGERFQTVFVETPYEVRVRRTVEELGITNSEAEAIISSKDGAKQEHGAHRVEEIADIILDNSTDDLKRNAEALVSALGL